MSVTLNINDYDDYSYTIDTSNNIQMTNINNCAIKSDLSQNKLLFKGKEPLDILKGELKLKIDSINPLELLDYDYEEHISSTGDQYSRISYTGVEKSLEALKEQLLEFYTKLQTGIHLLFYHLRGRN